MPPELIVAGVLALDNLKTPHGEGKKIVGGAGVYSSVAASIFTETALVAAIGNDFPVKFMDEIKSRNINIKSVKELDYPTFHWSGEYVGDMSQAITHATDFQINEHYDWEIANEHRKAKALLLCNNDPNIQLRILDQMDTEITAMDTMNLWIDTERKKLDEVVSRVDVLFINDAEAQLYSGLKGLDDAASELLQKGPKYVIIKKGEHGASLYTKKTCEHRGAFLVKDFIDPTGAGDSFAGAAMGYLTSIDEINIENIVTAMDYGAAVASVTVEGLGTSSIMNITEPEIQRRFQKVNGGPGRI
tara:strand:+ start:1045 stop:1950 length:906 start_codon:yes stop_codon:yes gene_type:complete